MNVRIRLPDIFLGLPDMVQNNINVAKCVHIRFYTQCGTRQESQRRVAMRTHTGFHTQCGTWLGKKMPITFTPAFTLNAMEGWNKSKCFRIGFHAQCNTRLMNQWTNTHQPLHSYEDRRPCLPMYSGWGIWHITSWWLENKEETLHSHGHMHSADCWLITSHVC